MKQIILGMILTISSTFAMATTALDQNNIQGEYSLKSKDVYIAVDLVLEHNNATMHYADIAGLITCEGSYKFDSDQAVLITQFNNCGKANTISHKISLENQSLETLSATTKVFVSISSDRGNLPNFPFTLTKIK